MLRKKSKLKNKIVVVAEPKKDENPFREALISVFGKDQIEEFEREKSKGPKRYRIKFTFKPLKEFLEQNPTFFDCPPEKKHERIVNYPFLDIDEEKQQECLKYNIMSIKQVDMDWVVEYFDLIGDFKTFVGTKEEITKFFVMDASDLYYIAKVIIPVNNRADSPFYKPYIKIKK